VARGGGHCPPRQRRCVTPASLFIRFFLYNRIDQLFLILYRELYYRHVYSRLQPDIDDRFHSYENSCELFNYLLSGVCHLLHSRPAQVMRTQTRRMALYRFSFRNSGYGTSSTSLSINSSPSTCGVQKSRPRRRKNWSCWLMATK
jgi:hypothetical protein